jgi:hypothetical protein
VSLVSLSHDDGLRNTMESIYAHDFKFDLLVERAGKVAALRLFLDLAVSMLLSRRAGEVTRYARALLRERYSGLDRIAGLMRPVDDPVAACKFDGVPRRTVPVAQHV